MSQAILSLFSAPPWRVVGRAASRLFAQRAGGYFAIECFHSGPLLSLFENARFFLHSVLRQSSAPDGRVALPHHHLIDGPATNTVLSPQRTSSARLPPAFY